MEHIVRFPGLGIELTLNEVAFKIGDFSVYWYGIIIAIGFLLAVIYAMKSADKMKLNKDHLFDGVFVGLIAGIIGARLYYVLFYPGDRYWKNPLEILDIRDGGLGIYGGLILALIAATFVCKWRKMSIGAAFDIASLGFLIGQGVGRWANFINQEAFGDNTTLPWGMISDGTKEYMQSLANSGVNVDPSAPVHPCFFYESMLCFIGFILLHFFTRKLRRYDGQTFLLYMIWYGISRFIVEGLRTDSLMVPFIPIKVSQLVALASVAVGIILLIALKKKTTLTGCGNKDIMELNGIDLTVVKKEEVIEVPSESTLFKGEKYMYNPDEEQKEENEEEQGKAEDEQNN